MPDYEVEPDFLRHALGRRALGEIGERLFLTELKAPLKSGLLSLKPASKISIQVLNRPEQKDDDAVFGAKAHIPFDLQSAWVKYKLTVQAEGKTSGSPLAFEASKALELADYRLHEPGDSAWDALQQDLAAPRTILSLDDVRTLRPGEALMLEEAGALSAEVRLSWADVIGSHLTELVAGLGDGSPLRVRVRSGAELSVDVEVSDRFTVIVSRTSAGRFRFTTKRGAGSERGARLSIGASVDASLVGTIEEALEPLFEALTGVALEAAERAAARLGIAELTTEEEQIVDRLVRRLGIDTAAGREKRVKKAVAELKGDLRKRLERVLRRKAEISFAYEYARLEEHEAIADYVLLDDRLLEHDWRLALERNTAATARALRSNAGSRELLRYLNESALTRRASSGFELALGRWSASAKSSSTLKEVTRTSADNFRLLTLRGTRRYEEKSIPRNDVEWVADLRAHMVEYLEHPRTTDFDCGLAFTVTLERRRIGQDDLRRMLDYASMWSVPVPESRSFADALGRKGRIDVRLALDRADLALVLADEGNDDDWSRALAAAMPWFPSEERLTHERRVEVYGDAWQAWLRGASARDSASLVRLRRRSSLASLESRALPGSFTWTAGQGHPRLRASLRSFQKGVRLLHQALVTPHPPELFGEAYAAMQRFWTQRLYVAACGVWLVARAREAGVDLNRSLQVEAGGNATIS